MRFPTTTRICGAFALSAFLASCGLETPDEGPQEEVVEQAVSNVTYYATLNADWDVVHGVTVVSRLNNAGGINTISRQGVGNYTVTIPAMYSTTLRHNIQITSWSSAPAGQPTVECAPTNEGGVDNDFAVTVRCFRTDNGLAADMGFTLVYRMDSGVQNYDAAYARNSGPSTVGGSWNSRGGPNTVTRTSLGHYTFTFSGLSQTANGGSAQVTNRTVGRRCSIASWGITTEDTTLNVVCTSTGTALGQFADADMYVFYSRYPIVPFGQWAHAWADQPSTAIGTWYTPMPFYQGSANGQAVQVARWGTGSYQVKFPKFLTTAWPRFGFVTAYGDADTVCAGRTDRIILPAVPATVWVDCTQNGAHVDSRFVVNYFQ